MLSFLKVILINQFLHLWSHLWAPTSKSDVTSPLKLSWRTFYMKTFTKPSIVQEVLYRWLQPQRYHSSLNLHATNFPFYYTLFDTIRLPTVYSSIKPYSKSEIETLAFLFAPPFLAQAWTYGRQRKSSWVAQELKTSTQIKRKVRPDKP